MNVDICEKNINSVKLVLRIHKCFLCTCSYSNFRFFTLFKLIQNIFSLSISFTLHFLLIFSISLSLWRTTISDIYGWIMMYLNNCLLTQYRLLLQCVFFVDNGIFLSIFQCFNSFLIVFVVDMTSRREIRKNGRWQNIESISNTRKCMLSANRM